MYIGPWQELQLAKDSRAAAAPRVEDRVADVLHKLLEKADDAGKISVDSLREFKDLLDPIAQDTSHLNAADCRDAPGRRAQPHYLRKPPRNASRPRPAAGATSAERPHFARRRFIATAALPPLCDPISIRGRGDRALRLDKPDSLCSARSERRPSNFSQTSCSSARSNASAPAAIEGYDGASVARLLHASRQKRPKLDYMWRWRREPCAGASRRPSEPRMQSTVSDVGKRRRVYLAALGESHMLEKSARDTPKDLQQTPVQRPESPARNVANFDLTEEHFNQVAKYFRDDGQTTGSDAGHGSLAMTEPALSSSKHNISSKAPAQLESGCSVAKNRGPEDVDDLVTWALQLQEEDTG